MSHIILHYFLIIIGFTSVWLFESKVFAAVIWCFTFISFGFETLTWPLALEMAALAAMFTLKDHQIFEAIPRNWKLSILLLMCWLIFTKNFTYQNTLHDRIWTFDQNEIYTYLHTHSAQILLAFLIAIFHAHPLRKEGALRITIIKGMPYIFASMLAIFFALAISGAHLNAYLPDFFFTWIIYTCFTSSIPEEIIFRLMVQNYIFQLSKDICTQCQKIVNISTIITTSLIYAASFKSASSSVLLILFIKSIASSYLFAKFKRIELCIICNLLSDVLYFFVFRTFF